MIMNRGLNPRIITKNPPLNHPLTVYLSTLFFAYLLIFGSKLPSMNVQDLQFISG